jgi:hypothetical protein
VAGIAGAFEMTSERAQKAQGPNFINSPAKILLFAFTTRRILPAGG